MAALTIIKLCLGVAKGPLTIVTSHTASRAITGAMQRGRDGANLSCLRQPAGQYVVAILTSQTLSLTVICMAKTQAVGSRRYRRWRVAAEFMARTAGRTILSLLAGRMTFITRLMGA